MTAQFAELDAHNQRRQRVEVILRGGNHGFFRIFGAGQGLRLVAVSLWLFRSQSHSIF